MNLPKIDLASLPDLDALTGVFGSLAQKAGGVSDDTIIIVMAYLYEVIPL